MQRCTAARAMRVMAVGHAHQTATLATDGTIAMALQAIRGDARDCAALALDLFPHFVTVQHGIGPDDDDGQGDQGIDRRPDFHVNQVAELGEGHEHAEQQDLEHRPDADLPGEAEYPAEPRQPESKRQPGQHIDQAEMLAQRRERRREGDGDGERPQALPHQFDRSRHQRRVMHDARGRHPHQHRRPQNTD